jgi:hypothetical protein
VNEFDSFDDFFPYYVSQHSKRLTRRFHFVGTHLGATAAVVGLARRSPALLAAAPAVAYGLAWFSHFVIEKNKPATFGHPLWSLRGDALMMARMWQGRDSELTEMAADVLAQQQPGLRISSAA